MSLENRAVAFAATLLLAAAAPAAPRLNGFELQPAAVPVEEILHGGPPRDGIPALEHPPHLPAAAAPWRDDERVLGVAVGGAARAYPVSLLVWHELVNDTLGGRPILVSYCPLCATGMVFGREVDGVARTFGVSGLLYRSDLLLYDRQTESLWSQISAEAITGSSAGLRLTLLRSRMLAWRDWRALHPDTTVLSPDTGHARRYGATPYGDYDRSRRLLFPAPHDPRYHPKMPTVGLRLPAGPARAYPAAELERAGGEARERFAGRRVRVAWDRDARTFRVEAPPEVEVVEGYWFAWSAFHPETSVFSAIEVGPPASGVTPEPRPGGAPAP